jgi:CBS domain containing-hemolysin-like protein
MFGKIAGTLGSKMLLALMSFLVVTLTSNNLGSEGFGYISLIILGITMVQMVNNFVGGPALVYLIPRFSFLKLFVPSYLWAVISYRCNRSSIHF